MPELEWRYFILKHKNLLINGLYLLLISGTVILISLLSWTPPVSRDALTHHLFVPKLYLQHGGIYEIPHFIFSYYPMNLDLLYLLPLYFQNDIAPKFIHFAFALVTAAMIYRYLLRRINMQYALLGSLFFLTIPVIVRLSSTVYVDLGLICFFSASLLYLFRWIESDFKLKYLILSAVFCGLALGTKYNGLVGLFLLGLFVPFVYSRYRAEEKNYLPKAIGCSVIFVAVSMVVFSPWMFRNFAWTGNPVYPLYNNYFNLSSTNPESSEDADRPSRPRISHIDLRKDIYGESWTEIALIPFRVFLQGEDDNPQYFDGRTNPFLLFLPVFAFICIRSGTRQEKTEKQIMLFFSVLFLLYACAQTAVRMRYFSPILPPLVILSMFGLFNLQNFFFYNPIRLIRRLEKSLVFCIIFVMLGLNVIYMAQRFERDQPLSFILGKVTRDEYIQKFRPEHESFRYANKTLSSNHKIFGLYMGNRGYYSDIPIEFGNSLLKRTAHEAGTGEEIASNLLDDGFTHLLINFAMFSRFVREYSTEEKKILTEFFNDHIEKEFSKDGYGLLRIKSVAHAEINEKESSDV